MLDVKRITKNTFFLYVRMFVAMCVSMVTAGVTLRVLGEIDYGLNAVLGGIVAMFSFMNGALAASVSRFITMSMGKGNEQQLSEVFNVALMVHILLAGIIFLLCETIGIWVFFTKMIIPSTRLNASFVVLQLSFFTSLFVITQVPYNALLVAREEMKIYAYFSILDVIVRLMVVLFLYISPFDKLITLAILTCIWSIISLIIYRVYCIIRYKETHFKFSRNLELYKEMIVFAASDFIGNLSTMIQGQGMNLLLNSFFGPGINAARGIAYNVQGRVTQFAHNFMIVAQPQITKSYAANAFLDMWKLAEWSCRISYFLVLFLALPICLEIDWILSMWFGQYPDHTVPFVYLVFCLCLLGILKWPIIVIMHATGRILLLNLVSGTVQCLSFPIAYMCLRLGKSPESVFIVSIGMYMLSNLTDMLVLKSRMTYSILRFCKRVYLPTITVTILATSLSYFIRLQIVLPGLVRVMITGVVTVVIVGCLVFLLGMPKNERTKMIYFVCNRLKLSVFSR